MITALDISNQLSMLNDALNSCVVDMLFATETTDISDVQDLKYIGAACADIIRVAELLGGLASKDADSILASEMYDCCPF